MNVSDSALLLQFLCKEFKVEMLGSQMRLWAISKRKGRDASVRTSTVGLH